MSQQTDQVFSGRYQLLRHIARGGMAEVYLAHDLMLDRRVALKVLFPELSTDRAFVERFRREAQAAANLTHPNIVSIFDWGEEDDTYFIVMEYVDGRTLSQVIRSEGPLLADRAADIGADVAAALGFAHRSGVVHRDVKPGNVLISSSGQVKVADFGIARATNTDENLTQTGTVMGTATYFSPEQAQGHAVDPRSDLYSLGVVLYEMVVGRPPFSGDNPMAVAYKHVREQPLAPRQVNADVPAQFESIVLQAMAKNPADRYVSAEELRADLTRFRQGRSVLANPTVAAPAVAPAATVANPAYEDDGTQVMRRTRTVTAPPPEEPPERRTGAFVVLLLVMLAVLGGLLYLFGREAGLFGTAAPARVEVPNVIGKDVADAIAMIEDAGLVADPQEEQNDAAEPGIVFDQEPKAPQVVDRNSTVILKVSAGAEEVEVPEVVGQTFDRASDLLEGLGLRVRRTDKADDAVPRGEVMAQSPAAGKTVRKGDEIELTVSSGKPEITVPDVTGLDNTEAAAELGAAGFRVTKRTEPSSEYESGIVIRTEPSAGTRVEKGSTVTLIVSTGPEQVRVPDVVGLSASEAQSRLEAAGFRVRAVEESSSVTNHNKVIAQDPDGGTQADKGSTVTITVGKATASSTSTTSTTSTSSP